ncbi:hypothetical protein [Sphingomonas trueperi]|uniref:hypothetical protein n=1 Tax=Sphingomonas trueperi TaxID=53317 RepID=UPI000F0E4001
MTEAPLSLHFGLVENERADLETVANAAVEWVGILRDLASIVSPDLEFEVEFVESEEGSVWLSNLVKAVRAGDRKALAALTFSAVLFFAMGPVSHLQTDAGNAFWKAFGHVDTADLSDSDKQDIANKVVLAFEKTDLAERRRRIVRQVEKDSHVTSIGIGYTPAKKGPIAAIPRAQFPIYGAAPEVESPLLIKETKFRNHVVVKIVRANLRENELKPRWRFMDANEEWSADLEDGEFVAALNHEATGLPLAVGQKMTVNVAIDGYLLGEEFIAENRRITRVIVPQVERRQLDFLGDD